LEIDMLTPTTIVAIAYVLVIGALVAWVVRRQAKVRGAYQRRAAIIAHMRRVVDKDGPIVGGVVRDDPAPAKAKRPTGESH
jgi:hypothetical protein